MSEPKELPLVPPKSTKPGEYDIGPRNAEIRKIINMTKFLCAKFDQEESKMDTDVKDEPIDLDFSNKIAGILSTMFTCMRKMKNPVVARRDKTQGIQNAEIGTKCYTISEMIEEYEKDPNYKEFDFQLASPIVDLLTAFKLSYDEVRVSCSKFKVRSATSKPDIHQISHYGLENVHIPWLRGITFPPERRSGLLGGMGPLALAILLIHEKTYFNKLEKAFLNSLKMLPMAPQLCTVFKSATDPSAVGNLLRNLGDVVTMIGDRSSYKIYYPLLFFVRMMETIEETNWGQVSFTGLRALYSYSLYSAQFKWKKKSSGTSEDIAQVVFHAMFDGGLEDFGVLSGITNYHSWKKREELGQVFKLAQNANSRNFTPIKFTRFSRLAAANMSGLAGTMKPMLINSMVFSGHRKRSFSQAFKTYIESGTQAVAYGTDQNSLCYALQSYKMALRKMLDSEDKKEAGSSSWYNWDKDKFVIDKTFFVQKSGQYFYS